MLFPGSTAEPLLFWLVARNIMDLLFFGDVEHGQRNKGIIHYLRNETEVSLERNENGNPSDGILFISNWFFHPDDVKGELGRKSGETYDVAVAILPSSDSHYQTCLNNALPMRTLGDYRNSSTMIR